MPVIAHKHLHVKQEAYKRGCVGSLATLITAFALAVILCAALSCALLPSAHAITSIVMPVILPAVAALVLTIPCYVINRKKSILREQLLKEAKRQLDSELTNLKDFILQKLLPQEPNEVYDIKFLEDLLALYKPKDKKEPGPLTKSKIEALQEAIKAVRSRTVDVEEENKG